MNPPASDDDRVWRALCDRHRREILDVLAAGPRTTGELVERFATLCRTGVMKHLDVLESAGLVVVRRQGRTRWNHFNPVSIERICGRWLDAHRRRMSGALNRLKRVVEVDVDGPSATGAQSHKQETGKS